MTARNWKPRAFLSICFAIALFDVAYAAPISGQGTWESTLQGRDLDGDLSTFEAYYDTALDITWLADANHAQSSGYDADGRMDWFSANAWAANLDPYGSNITGWRLPTVTDTGDPGCDFAFSGTDCGYNVDTSTGEMAHMFYLTLGNTGACSTSGDCDLEDWGLSNTGPFSNIQADYSAEFGDVYWSGTEYAPYAYMAWYMLIYYGYQDTDFGSKDSEYYAWAVHDGDVGVSAVPLPAAVWMFGSGLLMLAGMGTKLRWR